MENTEAKGNNKGENELVVPGELLVKGIDFLPGSGAFREKDMIWSKRLGLVKYRNSVVTVVPLTGVYIPNMGDGVIGTVSDVQANFWMVDINAPYEARLFIFDLDEFVNLERSDLTDYFDVDDVIYSRIMRVTKNMDVRLTMKHRMCRKLEGGNIITVSPTKVPRLIGKGGSMIEMIKSGTGCHIIVGQNGLVWLKGENEKAAIEAIETVERESHTSGLTERIANLLGIKGEMMKQTKEVSEYGEDETYQ